MNKSEHPYHPPKWLDKLVERFCAPHLLEEVMGDLHERYYLRVQRVGEAKARKQYWREVLAYIRPSIFKRQTSHYTKPIPMDMFRNYLKIGLRNMARQKVYSFINIVGLAIGMMVTLLIGLWIWDELSFNKYHDNYDRIVQVMWHATYEGDRYTQDSHVTGLGSLLHSSYDNYFEHVVMATRTAEYVIATEDKKLTQQGSFMHPEAPEMLTLHMLQGTRTGLRDMNAILISKSLADKLFGKADPLNKTLTINASLNVTITGVYEDLPKNSEFHALDFITSLDLFFASNSNWTGPDQWDNYYMLIYAKLLPHTNAQEASSAIKDILLDHIDPERAAREEPAVFLHPMRKWHLHAQFENGINTTSKEQMFVWFFGFTGVFVLLLACINFMNLSTARSEKRAKEVGIRKSIGSVRSQLISQFLSESTLVAALAFILALMLVVLILPWFNQIADKEITVTQLVIRPWFWLAALVFTLITGLLAGSYPAFYLSSFQPVRVLKGTFRTGRFAAVPRQVLVVLQFTVSIALIIGTITVYQQIQFVKDRPVGYDQQGLLMLSVRSPEFRGAYDRLRNELISTGVVAYIAQSNRPLTTTLGNNDGFDWPGKDPDYRPTFNTIWVSYDYGNTIGWEAVAGRDFSRDFATDSSAVVITESALKLMGLDDPVGEVITFNNREKYTIVGVVEDMVKGSPYEAARPSIIFHSENSGNWLFIKIKPQVSAREALPKIETVFNALVPSAPFDYKFVDNEYEAKFQAEERAGTLAGIFTFLAIFISCLGLFGLASYVAEQRTKEIGIRKVLGASVASLWQLLSKDFVLLVAVACLIAIPVAYYFLHGWLQNYEYRIIVSWEVFALSGLLALIIALLTVSFQAIKAALANPVDSLRNE